MNKTARIYNPQQVIDAIEDALNYGPYGIECDCISSAHHLHGCIKHELLEAKLRMEGRQIVTVISQPDKHINSEIGARYYVTGLRPTIPNTIYVRALDGSGPYLLDTATLRSA